MGEDDVVQQDICRDRSIGATDVRRGTSKTQLDTHTPSPASEGKFSLARMESSHLPRHALHMRAHTHVKVLGGCCGGGVGSCQDSWKEGGGAL